MPLLRSPNGAVIDVPAEQVGNYVGYEPVEGADASRAIASPESPDRGVLGGLNAAATGILSGATLGLSDYALKGVLDQGQFERLAAEREGHPVAGGIGQVAGAILPAIAAPGSLLARAPSGLVSHGLAPLIAEGRALGGAAGAGKVLLAGGIEGAAQNAGMYLADTALGDRELSAEGLAASLGPGFAFGVAGGAAALGVEKGTIAARRMFARVGGADKAAVEAEQAWLAAHQSTVEANDAAADLARAKLADAKAAREQAQLIKQRAQAGVADAKVAPGFDWAGAELRPTPRSTPLGDVASEADLPLEVQIAGKLNDRAHTGLVPGVVDPRRVQIDAELAALKAKVTGGQVAADGASPLSEARKGVWQSQRAKLKQIGLLDEEIDAMTHEQARARLGMGPQPVTVPEAKEAELAQAVAEHDAARAELDDILRRLEAPDIGPGIAPPERGVPVGEFGAPGQRGYDPGNVKAPGPPSVMEAQTADVTAVGKKKFAQGTPIEGAAIAPPNEQAPMVGGAVSVKPVGRPSAGTLEATLADGTVKPLTKHEVGDWVQSQLPDGFTDGGHLQTYRPFSIEYGIPATAEDIVENSLYVVKPSHLIDDGLMGNELRVANRDSVLSAWNEGKRLRPVDVDVAPDGRLYVEDGNHRIQAAARDDRPIVVRFRKTGPDWKPQSGAHDISGRVAAELPKTRPEATDSLTGQLRGMKSQLGAGADLKAMGAPGRAEYAAAKAERTAAASEHFRAQANAKNYAGSQMAADEAAARSELAIGGSASEPKNPKRVEASRKAAAASVERRREIHSAVASNLPDELQVAWDKEGYKFMQEESARIRGNRDPISAASDISESFTEKYGSASESGRGYEGDRYHRRLEIEAKHADSWAKEQSKRHNAIAKHDEAERVRDQADRIASIAERWKRPADDVTELWSERAAVLEYEGGMSRIEAERTALDEISGMVNEAHGRTAMDEFFRNLTRPKTRDAYVAANIGRAMREEGSHAKALAKVEREWADVTSNVRSKATTTPFDFEQSGLRFDRSTRNYHEAPPMRSAVDDVAHAAEVVTKYERASAKLTEALGPDAPPAAQQAAKAFREAEEAAERKQMERTTRAIDDHADAQAKAKTVPYKSRAASEAKQSARGGQSSTEPAPPPNNDWIEEAKQLFGGRRLSMEERLAKDAALRKGTVDAAKQDVAHADAALSKARVAETEAKIGARQATDTAVASRAAMEAAAPGAAAVPTSALGSLATTAAVIAEMGVPGLPHPHDIPVIGPLLGIYLKYKAFKYAAGRFVGRVPATADARAASLVARTKDRIATAVDRTLGLAEAAAPKMRGGIVATSTVLGHRLLDDGEPDAPKDANAQQMAAVRIREIANASTRPELVTQLVRREMHGVVDPDLLAAAEKHLMARFEALAKVMPKAPPPNPYSKREWLPSPAAAYDLAQRLAVVHDPEQAFIDPTPAKAQTAAAVYPKLLQYAQQRLMDRIGDASKPVPYEQRIRGALVFKVPLDDSLQPDHAAILATAHAPSPITDAQPAPQQAPTPSIASNTNLTSVYQTGIERRAMR